VEGAPNIAHESSLVDVLDRVLDKGVVVDESMREHEHDFYSVGGIISTESEVVTEW
jgi:hypothetical protein